MSNAIKWLFIFSLASMLISCGGASSTPPSNPPGSPISVGASAKTINASVGGQVISVYYIVSNNSNATVTGFGSAIIARDSKDTSNYFQVASASTCGSQIPAGGACRVNYRFQAPASAKTGVYQYTVGFQYAGRYKQNPQSLKVNLSAKQGNVTVLASTETLENNVNGAPVTATYTLQNASTTPTYFDKVVFSQSGSTISKPNDIQLSNTASCQTIDPGKQCQLHATFYPISSSKEVGSYELNFNFHNAPTVAVKLTTKLSANPPLPGDGTLTISPVLLEGKQDPYTNGSDKLYSQPGVPSEPAIFKLSATGGRVSIAKTGALNVTVGSTNKPPTDTSFTLVEVPTANLPDDDTACQVVSPGDYIIPSGSNCDIGVQAQYNNHNDLVPSDLNAYLPQLNTALFVHLIYSNSSSSNNTATTHYGLSLSPNVMVRASLVDSNNTKAVQVNLMNPVTGETIGFPVKLNISQPIDGDTCQADFYTGNPNNNVPVGTLPMFSAYFKAGGHVIINLGCALTNSAGFASLSYDVALSKFATSSSTAIDSSGVQQYNDFNFTGPSARQPIVDYAIGDYPAEPSQSIPFSKVAITALPDLQTYFKVKDALSTSVSAMIDAPGVSPTWGTDNLSLCDKGCGNFGHIFNVTGPIPSESSTKKGEQQQTYLTTGVQYAATGGVTAYWLYAIPALAPGGYYRFFSQSELPIFFPAFRSTPPKCNVVGKKDPTWPMAGTFSIGGDNSPKLTNYFFYASALPLTSSNDYGGSVSVEGCSDSTQSLSLMGSHIYLPQFNLSTVSKVGAYSIYKTSSYIDGAALVNSTNAKTARVMYLAVAPYTAHDQYVGPDNDFYYWLVMLSLDANGKPVITSGSAYTVYLAKRDASDSSNLKLTTTNKFSGGNTFAIVPLYLTTAP